ncbi:hypothetical protein N7466_005704 [Penicillium verhagenii]|uniref:uncharacterized protein n=1 Tax=Penicillium verhagenii TaxID=1562060 RepID=UPI0025458E17|nr:uncharacterized protein N7466_005704 [Penicillium verhagenii]KAJ5930211.1 hypothetical protein N7466_005704 [Penicillium verhagenii]
MPLFNLKKSRAPANQSASRFSARSVENLVHPASPQDHNSNYVDRHHSNNRLAYEEPTSPIPQPQPDLSQPALRRAQSLRQQQQKHPHQKPLSQQRDRQITTPEDSQPRRIGLFQRPTSGFIDRNSAVTGIRQVSQPLSQPSSPRHPPPFESQEQQQHQQQQHQNIFPEEESPTDPPAYEPRSTSLAYQHQHLQHSQRSLHHSHPSVSSDIQEWSPQQPVEPQQGQLLIPPGLSTDPTLVQQYGRPSPTDRTPDSPRYLPEHGHRGPTLSRPEYDLVLNTSRPPSRQTYESLSPSRLQTPPDAMQQASAQAIPQGQSTDRLSGQQERRGSTTQNMPTEQHSRNTPTGPRTRDELENLDIRALIQKHDELQSKYSKVKRYYFEKEAQVQHLQNTVAHQRMAVSRTVLDDNEYTNRFQRLDGAIKDLAFSVRKDWRIIPSWLQGLTTDDAVTVGTKEMMALGRAVVSRWLMEEVFQRHFHPGLEPGLSIQLKSIEMNLRRQQMRPVTDEDRENAIAKLSNWRRTTFDGLGDTLANPTAQEHRAELIEHLTVELATFLSNQLQDQALPGLEAGVRMIIENTINIIEKIPLEARDVCVEYFPPNISFHDNYMKVEGQLPHLTQPPPPADQEVDDEGDSSPASNSTGPGVDGTSPAPREPRRRSVFGALMGRRPAADPPARPAAGTEKTEQTEPSRIRFASFLTVEVRGKGPATVLIKAPVWLIE